MPNANINFKVIGLTQPGSKVAGSRLKPVIFEFLDLAERELGALLIRPPITINLITQPNFIWQYIWQILKTIRLCNYNVHAWG